MKIREFLQHSRQRLVTCFPEATLNTVAKLLYQHSIGAMPVCEIRGKMVGVISERDLVRVFARIDLSELQFLRAGDVMTTQVVTCTPDDAVKTAQKLMLVHHFRHIPVIQDDKVTAMLSLRDIMSLRLEESESEMNFLRDVVVAARYQ